MVIRSREEAAAESNAAALRAASTSLRLPSPSGSGAGLGLGLPPPGAPLGGGGGSLTPSPRGPQLRVRDSPASPTSGQALGRGEDPGLVPGLGSGPMRSSPSQPRMGALPPLPGPPRSGSRPASAGPGNPARPYQGPALALPALAGGMAKAASASAAVPPPMIPDDFFSSPAPVIAATIQIINQIINWMQSGVL